MESVHPLETAGNTVVMKKSKGWFLFVWCLSFLWACQREEVRTWVAVENCDAVLWTADSSLSYEWEGGCFDRVVHGKGVLRVCEAGNLVGTDTVEAWYGAVSRGDVVRLRDGSSYVGALRDGLFEGFGVYVEGGNVYAGWFAASKPEGMLNWYKDGKLYYSGEWVDGTFQGEGTLYREDGAERKGTWENGMLVQTYCREQTEEGVYDGYVLDGKPDGVGSMRYNDGSRYEGEWSGGKWDGTGNFYTTTDSVVGEWKGGKLHGVGIVRTPCFLYEGDFEDGKPDGIGYLAVSDSSFYSGEWEEGKRSGYGSMVFANSDSYFGDWRENQFEGIGEYTFAINGDYYYGEWKAGLQHGVGRYRSENFEYEGNWEEGWINGEGRMTYANGDSYEGNFVENERYGMGLYQFKDGNSYEGEFVDGEFNGLGIFRFTDGSVYVGEFADGKIKGDGTLYYVEGADTIAITANWDGSNQFPSEASVLFGNGDLYEGELKNGFPTENGVWTTAEERESGVSSLGNSLVRANEFYKRHKETWNKVVKYTSIALTVVEIAAPVVGAALIATGVGAPVGAALIVVGQAAGYANVALNVADAAIATTSAGIDAYENIQNGEDAMESLKTLGSELATNAAFVVVPKALKSLPIRKAKVALSASAKTARGVAKTTTVVLKKEKTFGKMVSITKNDAGVLQKTTKRASVEQMAKNAGTTIKKKFQSGYLASILPKTRIYKELKEIKAKGPISIPKKDFDYLLSCPPNEIKGNLRAFIKTYTGDKKNYSEFFIRLAMGNKKQAEALLNVPNIKKFVDNSIRSASGQRGMHEWLMTSNFKSFLFDDKWGEDGYFLVLAQSKLIQETGKVNFKVKGGHISARRPNSPESSAFHDRLTEVIHGCNSKEELFVEVRAFAKRELNEESYQDFNRIFKEVFSVDRNVNQ